MAQPENHAVWDLDEETGEVVGLSHYTNWKQEQQ